MPTARTMSKQSTWLWKSCPYPAPVPFAAARLFKILSNRRFLTTVKTLARGRQNVKQKNTTPHFYITSSYGLYCT
jgi:hypothetical protein